MRLPPFGSSERGPVKQPAARRQEVYAADRVIVINLIVVEFKTLKIYVYTVHYRRP
jgi:hypothetical protein